MVQLQQDSWHRGGRVGHIAESSENRRRGTQKGLGGRTKAIRRGTLCLADGTEYYQDASGKVLVDEVDAITGTDNKSLLAFEDADGNGEYAEAAATDVAL